MPGSISSESKKGTSGTSAEEKEENKKAFAPPTNNNTHPIRWNTTTNRQTPTSQVRNISPIHPSNQLSLLSPNTTTTNQPTAVRLITTNTFSSSLPKKKNPTSLSLSLEINLVFF